MRRLRQGSRLGFERLLVEHRGAWAGRWEDADVQIDGDPELQLAVRFALFHLMASVADEGEAAVGARGLSGAGYRGHVFWDSDVFVLPFLAATHPAARRGRCSSTACRRLPAARRAARAAAARARASRGSRPASGEDVTPVARAGPRRRDRPIRTGRSRSTSSPTSPGPPPATLDWTGDEELRRRARRASCSSRPRATGPRGSGSTPTGAGTSTASSAPTSTTSPSTTTPSPT